ncbi:hypothetical protein ACTJJB_04265 [Chitinophaga sp. 22536]|uniref:hypothetical protein n=1 Tax=unclassified Chitinophaga TaxID=2619133 RepID=UPI003F8681CE
MATGFIVLTVVDVGQGQCTFLEVYDDSKTPKLIQTVMMDCGSDKKSDDTPTNLEYIATRVASMAKPAFDCIIFSHSDKDHISLTQDVLDLIPATKKPVVKKVVYGGDYDQYEKSHVNILDDLQTNGYCTRKDIISPGSYKTNYDKKNGKFAGRPLWESSDKAVKIYSVVANVLSNDPDWDSNDEDLWGSKAEEKNRVSIICGLYYAGVSYVICGDATNVTMSVTNQLFKGTTVFKKNEMTTLPHHGSRATAYAVPRTKDPSDAAVKVVNTFAKLMNSRILTASAFEKHRHPSLMLMNAFLPTLTKPFLRDARLKQQNTHRLNAYVDIDIEIKNNTPPPTKKKKTGKTSGDFVTRDSVWSFDSTTCTFTTRYTNPWLVYSYNLGNDKCEASDGVKTNKTTKAPEVINPHACWQWDGLSDGECLVGGYADLSLPLTIFTSGAVGLAIQPGGPLGRRAVWEFDKDGNEIAGKDSRPSPVTVRSKNIPVRQPASSPKQFQRLQQFY